MVHFWLISKSRIKNEKPREPPWTYFRKNDTSWRRASGSSFKKCCRRHRCHRDDRSMGAVAPGDLLVGQDVAVAVSDADDLDPVWAWDDDMCVCVLVYNTNVTK